MKQRLPSRPKQALHIAFPYTNWGQVFSCLHSCPPLLNFKINISPKRYILETYKETVK